MLSLFGLANPSTASRPAVDDALRARICFWLALALVPLNLFLLGYVFGEGDQNEQLPMILRALDPNYLRGDWIVNANQGFNHRWFYTQFIAGLSHLLTLDGAYYALYVLCLLAWSVGMMAFFQTIWNQDEAGESPHLHQGWLIGGVMAGALMLFCHWGSIGTNPLGRNLIPTTLAWPAMVWFAVLLRRGQLKWAGALLLATGLLHALVGPLSGLFLLLAQAYALGGKNGDPAARRALLRHLPLWAIAVLLPLVIAVFSTRGTPLSAQQSREVVELLVYVRHPWHYAPLLWPRSEWVGFLAWLGFVWVARRGAEPSRFLDGLLGVALLFCLSGFLPFLIDKLFPLVKFQHFRMTVWLQIVGSLYVARWLGKLWASGDLAQRIGSAVLLLSLLTQTPLDVPNALKLLMPLGAAGFLLLSHRSQNAGHPNLASLLFLLPWLPIWAISSSRHELAALSKTVFVFLFVAAAIQLTLKPKPPRFLLRGLQTVTGIGAILALLAVLPRVPSPLGKLTSKVQPHFTFRGDEGKLWQWVSQNTPTSAVFISPTDMEEFRLKANRAIVVTFKVFPWGDADLLLWRKRLNDLSGGQALPLGYGFSPQLQKAYVGLTSEQVKALTARYGAAYFVAAPQAKGDFSGWPLLYKNGAGSVYKVPAQAR